MSASNTNIASSIPSCLQRRQSFESNGNGLGLAAAMMRNQYTHQNAAATTIQVVPNSIRARQQLSDVLNNALQLLDDYDLFDDDDDLFGSSDMTMDSIKLRQ
jgi:hypothetical protein